MFPSGISAKHPVYRKVPTACCSAGFGVKVGTLAVVLLDISVTAVVEVELDIDEELEPTRTSRLEADVGFEMLLRLATRVVEDVSTAGGALDDTMGGEEVVKTVDVVAFEELVTTEGRITEIKELVLFEKELVRRLEELAAFEELDTADETATTGFDVDGDAGPTEGVMTGPAGPIAYSMLFSVVYTLALPNTAR